MKGSQYQNGKIIFSCFRIVYKLEGMESKELQKEHVTEDKEGVTLFRISSEKIVIGKI